jgi:hypothetical protein
MLRQPLLFNQADPHSREWPFVFLDRAGRRRSDEEYKAFLAVAALAARLIGHVFSPGYEPPTQPVLPPESVASAAGWNAVTTENVNRDTDLLNRLGRLQYCVLPADSGGRNATWGEGGTQVWPDNNLVDHMAGLLNSDPGGFAISTSFPLSPRRTFFVTRFRSSVLCCFWVRADAMQGTQSDALVLILSGQNEMDEKAALSQWNLVSDGDQSVSSNRPLVVMECNDPEVGSNYYVEQMNRHLAIAFLRHLETAKTS